MVFMLGSVPATGNHFGYSGFRFEVADMDGRRVDKVIVEMGPVGEDTGTEPQDPESP